MKIFISGSLAYDRIMDFPEKFSDHILPDKIHILNVCFMVNGLKEQFGGTAGNIAYNLALLGECPLILASAGKDFGSYEAWLRELGLSVHGIRKIPDEFTAGAYITTDKADNQITGFNPGAMKHQCMIPLNGEDPSDSLAIVAPGNLDDMLAYSRCCKEVGIPYIFDPGQSIPALSPEKIVEMITGSKLTISNDYELELITRSTGLSKSDLLDRTEAIITTLGERGALMATRRSDVHIPAANPARVSDPTGAGDAFRAGLIKGLVLGKNLVDAAKLGAVCASFGVECQGTQCHRFSLEEFWARHEANFGPVDK
ncbi:MAG TPA: carbohydrate kinase family protein [Desulfomonilaceae bacterium]|nr:carbohydrate kinase family protein [Desulfomonilaceae bacterium]